MLSEKIVRDLQVTRGWTREYIDALTPYYVATLTHLSEGHTGPIYRIIDEMWHTHILRTRDYADFCATNFGRFIHHERFDEPVVHEQREAQVDLFCDYGLSLERLEAICAQKPQLATCEQNKPIPNPSPSPKPEITPDRPKHTFAVAKCEQPQPPTAPVSGAIARPPLAVAACEQPDQPVPPRSTGGPIGVSP